MKVTKWVLWTVFIASLGFGLGQEVGNRDKGDKRQAIGTDYKITGYIDPMPGQSFPNSWGRLVNYQGVGDQYGRVREQRFIFEDDDGTIRIVKTDLNWNSNLIDDAEVITIGRSQFSEVR